MYIYLCMLAVIVAVVLFNKFCHVVKWQSKAKHRDFDKNCTH